MSASRAKGTRFESDVVAYLRDHGFPTAERRALHGTRDRGDVAGVPGLVIEAKNEARMDLAGYMAELAAEVANDGARLGVAVVKRRSKPVGDAYVVMPLHAFVAWLTNQGD